MTPLEAFKVVSRIELKGLFTGFYFSINCARDVELALYGHVPDRDTGTRSPLTVMRKIDDLAEIGENLLLAMCQGLLEDVARHEVREAFTYEGWRPNDPHAHEVRAQAISSMVEAIEQYFKEP